MGIVGRGRPCGVQSLQGDRVTSERDKAIRRHEARTLGTAANVYPVHTPDPQGGLDVLGRVHAVTYTGTLQGDGPHLYEHRFDPDAAPLLGADSRGQLFIFGGRYTTTERGITDTDPPGHPGGFEGEQVNPRHRNPADWRQRGWTHPEKGFYLKEYTGGARDPYWVSVEQDDYGDYLVKVYAAPHGSQALPTVWLTPDAAMRRGDVAFSLLGAARMTPDEVVRHFYEIERANPISDTLIRGGRKARELARKGARRVGEWSAREAAAACRELGYTKGNPPPPPWVAPAALGAAAGYLFRPAAAPPTQSYAACLEMGMIDNDDPVALRAALAAVESEQAEQAAYYAAREAGATIGEAEAIAAQSNPRRIRNVTPNPTLLPLAPENRKWNAAAARKRIKRWATKGKVTDWNRYARGFLYRDPAHPSVGYGFKLPIADVIKGRLVAVPHAIEAAGGVLDGARGGVDIPKRAHDQARRWVDAYYRKMNRPLPRWDQKG